MRSSVFVVVLLLLGCVMSLASPALPPTPAAAASSSPNSASSFQVSEYQVDADGLWSDHEIPLSDASIEAIRHATPATPEDIAAWNAEVEPEMQVQAVDEDDVESDVESENEPIRDDLEIAHGEEGRMLLIPHSRHFMMRRFIMFLTRLISKMKTHSSLARITLKLKVEPVTPTTPTPTPTPTPLPTRIRIRRPPPSLGIPYRPGTRPVAVRLIPSQSSLQTRRMLTRCSMLLRQAVQRLHHMRQMMMRERMKERVGVGMSGPNPWQIRGLRFPGRGVILFRSNNITATGPTYTSTTTNRLEIEGEKNGTVTIIAPRVNATLSHAVIVINRGTLILLNRSRNNTFAFSLPSRSEKDDSRRRFPLFPIPSHQMMNENVDEPQHTA